MMDENFRYSTYSIAQELLNFVYMNKRIYLHSYANHTGISEVVIGVMDRKCILSQMPIREELRAIYSYASVEKRD